MKAQRASLWLALWCTAGFGTSAGLGQDPGHEPCDPCTEPCQALSEAIGKECLRRGGTEEECSALREDAETHCFLPAQVSDCVASCLASALDGFDRCRDQGGTVTECSRNAELEFLACAGERGCQGACEVQCLAETTSAYSGCLENGGTDEECTDMARDVAEGCYPACSTDCELKCSIAAALTCLSPTELTQGCMASAAEELASCTEDCGDLSDKDEDGIPNGLDRCELNPHVACGTAHAGGPYLVSPATGIHLDGSGSLIPGGEIVDYSWDVNGDGEFGDVSGIRPSLSPVQFLGNERVVIGLRVTDDRGLSDTGFAEFSLSSRSFTIDDAEAVEGDEGTQELALTVRLSQAVRHPVTVGYLTGDGAPVKDTLGRLLSSDNCGIFKMLDLYQRGLLVHGDGTPPHEGGFPAWPHRGGHGDVQCRFYHWHQSDIDGLKGCGHGFVYQPDRHPHPALAGEDYVATSGTITFAPGQTESTIVVEIIGDRTFEPEKAFQVILRNPSVGQLIDGVGIVTIPPDGDVRAEDCSDGVDNNGDGLVDCDDPACGSDAGCPQALRAFVRCDATGDGVLDVSDAVHTVKELFVGVPEALCREATDCNGDRLLDISDVVFGLAFCFGGGAAPPPPFPECGEAEGVDGSTVDCEVYEACARGRPSADPQPLPPDSD